MREHVFTGHTCMPAYTQSVDTGFSAPKSRWLIFIYLSLCLGLSLLLPGCGTRKPADAGNQAPAANADNQAPTAGTDSKAQAEPADGPITRTTLCHNDFQITFSMPKTAYRAEDITAEHPLEFSFEIEYLGEEPQMEVFHASSISYVAVLTENGEPLVPFDMTQELCSTVLQKGEPLMIPAAQDFDFIGGIPKGSYTAMGVVEFSLDESLKEKVKCSQLIPFTIQ